MEIIKIEEISFVENDILSVHYLKIQLIGDQKNVSVLFFEKETAPYISLTTLTFYYTFTYYTRTAAWFELLSRSADMPKKRQL